MTRVCAALGTFVLVCSIATPAQAIPITEQTFVAVGGVVVVTLVSNEAGYTSELVLDGSPGDDFEWILDNAETPVSATMDLGPVEFEELGGGGGFDSKDDLVVASTNLSPADGAGSFASVNVVDDVNVVAEVNVVDKVNVVDEPSSLLMFGSGLVALVFAMKRQAVKR